jgi:hypothetical protein
VGDDGVARQTGQIELNEGLPVGVARPADVKIAAAVVGVRVALVDAGVLCGVEGRIERRRGRCGRG